MAEGLLQAIKIVVIQDQSGRGGSVRNASRAWMAKSQRAGSGLDQQGIVMPVITTLEFDDAISSGVTPCNPDGTHRRFRP